MSNILIKNAKVIATMDNDLRELNNNSIYSENGIIVEIGKCDNLNYQPDQIIDATDMVVIPGLINTHHHLFQKVQFNII